MADGRLFSVGGKARLYIAKQNSRHPPSSAALRPLSLRSAVQVRSARRQVIATKAAMGAANPTRDFTMATDRDDTDFEPPHTSSPTDHVIAELQLYGHRPFQDEADPRPLPEADTIGGAVADIFDALVSTLSDTRLEPDLEDLLWSTVNLFTAPPAGSSGNSTTMSRRSAAARRSRTARRSARSNSNASPPRASR